LRIQRKKPKKRMGGTLKESIIKERMHMKKNSQCSKVHGKTKAAAYEIRGFEVVPGGGGSRGAARGILTTTSIVIDISRGIAINVVHACIHGSFLRSSIGACCIATPT
jgi:hypothetical protein